MGAGSVGTAIAYACLIRGSARELALYDVNAKKVRAEVLDLNHGSPFVPPCRVIGGDHLNVTADSTIVIVTAGAKQHPGQSRLDLASTNVAMAQSLVPQLFEQSPDAVVVMVTNPVDLVTCAAVNAAGAPRGRVFGSGTVLDSSRFRHLIATRAGIAVENVHGIVVGEHGDSEIPVWSAVTVGGVPAAEYRRGDDKVFDHIAQQQISSDVVNAAYEIIAGKGATNLAIGLSTARIIEAIMGDQRRVLPVSTMQAGAHGISGVALSLPTVVSASGAAQVLEGPLSDDELAGLYGSARTLTEVGRSLGL